MTFVWGGGGNGSDIFDFSQPTTVIELNVQGLTEQDLLNLDTQKLQNDLSSSWDLPANSVVIIDPTSNDKMEFQGKTISNPAYGLVSEGMSTRTFDFGPDSNNTMVNVTETQSSKDYGFIGGGFLSYVIWR